RQAMRAAWSFGVRGWLAVLLFGVVLLALGWLVGGREPSARRTLALSSEARNLALTLVIANMAMKDEQVLLAIFAAWIILLALAGLVVALFRVRGLPTVPTGVPGRPPALA